MFPVLFHIGPVPLYSYGLMLAIAVLTASALMSREALKIGIAKDVIYDLVFWVVLCGIVGARIFYIFLNGHYFYGHPLEMVMLQKGGLAWQGALFAGFLSGIVYINQKRLPLGKVLDLSAPYIALGQAIGRIGCLLNGCCYGRHADWGLYFPVWGERLIPTQLFMSLDQAAIFIVLRLLAPRSKKDGQVFVWYLMLAAMERFVIEFFRADHDILPGGLSIFQYVCVALFLTAIWLNLWLSKRSQ
ncbi:MAG: prolipoprotein diacylglyceryl transferase [Candidatus Omnitrophica bacterium]|nr:prolipoprotein diacylglyceryl transferase [Candidatus Omnitrophota bacterium]